MKDDVYVPYCKTCGGKIHRGRGESWVHYKVEAAADRVHAIIKEFDLSPGEANILRALAAYISVTHKAEPVWTSAETKDS